MEDSRDSSAEDQERLRRLLADDLEQTRAKLTQSQNDAADARRTAIALNDRWLARCEQLELDLNECRENLARIQEVEVRQREYIGRLRKQTSRPMRLLAKKILSKLGWRRSR